MTSEAFVREDLRSGYVYVLSSPHRPEAIRFGSSEADIGVIRHERFGTRSPVACKVEFAIHVPDRMETETALRQKFVGSRLPDDRSLYAVRPRDAIREIAHIVGFDYTNAQITGLIFKKQVESLRKMEAEFRNRNKSFTILNGELIEIQKNMRSLKSELSARDGTIEALQAELGRALAECSKNRRNSTVLGSAAVVFGIGMAAIAAFVLI